MTEYTVEFVGTGEEIQVTDKENILSRCLEEGIAQEYSCRVGMCLACCAEIVDGEVNQPAATARGLTEEEAENYVLTCMAQPQSDLKLDRGKYPPTIEDSVARKAGAGDAGSTERDADVAADD